MKNYEEIIQDFLKDDDDLPDVQMPVPEPTTDGVWGPYSEYPADLVLESML